MIVVPSFGSAVKSTISSIKISIKEPRNESIFYEIELTSHCRYVEAFIDWINLILINHFVYQQSSYSLL